MYLLPITQGSITVQGCSVKSLNSVATLSNTALQVDLEALSTGLDYDMLPGKWRVVWTNAPDVVCYLLKKHPQRFMARSTS